MTTDQAEMIVDLYGVKKVYALFLIPLAALFVLVIRKVKRFGSQRKRWIAPASLLCLSASITFVYPLQEDKFASEINYHVIINKIKFFEESYHSQIEEQRLISNSDINKELDSYYAMNEIEKSKFRDYPFYSEGPLRNVLGPLFEKKELKPNIVFVIVESLGRVFSGSEARVGSFTPFLDSLAEHSLYWTNFLANAERTFGAIPNLIAGVPEGGNGFLNLRSSMPDHLSLPLLLKENNDYETGFFCGSVKKFDHIGDYLMFQKFEHIYDKPSFTTNKIKKDLLDNSGEVRRFNWGAQDLVVFEESFKLMERDYELDQPFFNLYLTTSFHEPYAYTNEERFIQMAKARIEQFAPPNKEGYLSEIETFAALMYTDHCLKVLIEGYAKRIDFEETIFVICGDHSIKFMSDNSRIEKYHVPLIIYSPMLKKSKTIKSVACHKDVPSAIQALLKSNFDVEMPSFSISQTNNLDSLTEYDVSNSNHVLMLADKRMNNYLWRNYFYTTDQIFDLKDGMKLNPIDNNKIETRLKKRLANYKILSHYCCLDNKYIPKSIYNSFVDHTAVLDAKTNFESMNDIKWMNVRSSNIDSLHAFSGRKSLTNLKGKYLRLLDEFQISRKNVHRLMVKFKLYCSDNEFPSLNFYLSDSKRGANTTVVFMNNEKGHFTETEKAGWFDFETAFWLEKYGKDYSVQLYLFKKNEKSYYLDDLEIEIKTF
ncbi:LTA synthase family protein [Crocinitomix catalasitica]|nr:LTA synthase family protein [Crocinitomix catalasitica]